MFTWKFGQKKKGHRKVLACFKWFKILNNMGFRRLHGMDQWRGKQLVT